MLKLLWDIFAQRVSGTTEEQSRGALHILGMAARSRPEIVKENTATLVSVGFGIYSGACGESWSIQDYWNFRNTTAFLGNACRR